LAVIASGCWIGSEAVEVTEEGDDADGTKTEAGDMLSTAAIAGFNCERGSEAGDGDEDRPPRPEVFFSALKTEASDSLLARLLWMSAARFGETRESEFSEAVAEGALKGTGLTVELENVLPMAKIFVGCVYTSEGVGLGLGLDTGLEDTSIIRVGSTIGTTLPEDDATG
jgi:hypothetical protein